MHLEPFPIRVLFYVSLEIQECVLKKWLSIIRFSIYQKIYFPNNRLKKLFQLVVDSIPIFQLVQGAGVV